MFPADDRPTSADRFLENALIANFVVHGLGMLAMAGLLLPTMPGGGTASDAERIATIASHPWRFRLGWLPWHLCAIADLALALALVRARWIPRGPAVGVLVLTVLAIAPDQYAQIRWVTEGVRLATEDPAGYLSLERALFPLTAGVAALLYTLAGIGWTVCFARAGTWSRVLTIVSVPLWSTMAVAVTAPLLPLAIRPSPVFVSVANAIGFTLLQVWLALVAEAVLRRARPSEPYGRLAPWRHHGDGAISRGFDLFANSRLFGALLEPLPEAEMWSDIEDVVYVNYVVPAAVAEPLVPPGLELSRIGPDGKYALFTFLTFRHGAFGFRFLGGLRKLLPSPVQTNWRIHVRDPHSGHAGIYFLTNSISAAPHALLARMFSEGMPMHVLRRGAIHRATSGKMTVELDPGSGSAPDALLDLDPCGPPALTGAFGECWPDFRAFLAYCVPQDRAMSTQPLRGRVSRQEISLGIPLEACEPLAGKVVSRAARNIVGDAEPVCFRVAKVRFRFIAEHHDPLGPPPPSSPRAETSSRA